MTVAIRKIAGTDRDYLADARKFAGRATCARCPLRLPLPVRRRA